MTCKTSITIVALILFVVTNALSQNYTFEYNTNGWVAKQGSLTLSSNHYKQGSKSMCWETSGNSQLEVSGFSVYATATKCANMFIYSPSISNDVLLVEFMNGNTVVKTGNYLFNYKGWHEFKRCYADYNNSSNVTINKIRFTLKPTTGETRQIFFDDVKLLQAKNSNKDILGSHWVLDFDVLEWVGASLDPHYLKDPYRLYANPRDIEVRTPTTEEVAALNVLRNKFIPNNKYYTTAYNNAKNYVNGLNLTRNADGTIKGGPVLDLSSDGISLSTINEIITPKLTALAGGVKNNVAGAPELFNLLFDYAIDQGMGEGCPIFASSNAYDNVRTLTGNWFKIIGGCSDDARYQEALKAMRWFSYYGAMYNPEESYLACINSDVLYLLTQPIMNTIVSEKDDAIAVRELRAFKRYIERSVSYVPGEQNMLKPDGTGFHHKVHYVNYMRAYKSVTDAFKWLKGTPFRISPEAYQSFRKAVLTNYILSTKDVGDNHSYALSLCGRHPFSSNHNISYNKSNFEDLVLVGRDCMGTSSEPIIEGAYNYFFKSTKYAVSPISYDGFHQFNYSPMGIYRKDNWVITMRCPTTELWGAEIYSKANRLGRYQSHGSLDVNYSGVDFSASGYPTNNTGGGWDWNMAPGTTTVHYTEWKKMMPKENVSQRFDQYNEKGDFSGALAFGGIGMFGCDFVQSDCWTPGNSQFSHLSTNLAFKKSFYCFDDMVIALGSNIGTSGSYPSDMITATNLFQEMVLSTNTILNVNSQSQSKGYNATLASDQNNWIITPLGTGYFIPQGNDPLVVKYADQTTPKANGSDCAAPTTTKTAVKAYLSHGYKTTGKKYAYILKPSATEESMNEIANAVNNNTLYRIERQDAQMHAISYLPKDVVAYCFYQGVSDLDFGIVQSTTSEHLLIDKKDEADGSIHHFAICNPDLHPQEDNRTPVNFGWLSTPSHTTLTLKGNFEAIDNVDGVTFYTPINGVTRIDVEMKDGEPIYFSVKKDIGAAIGDANSDDDWVTMKKQKEELVFDSSLNNDFVVYLYTVGGKLLKKTVRGENKVYIGNLPHGIYLCNVEGKNKSRIFKWAH